MRNLLHISKMPEFKKWLTDHGYLWRPGRGGYEVIQVSKDGKHWNCVYRRHHMPEHYTTDRRLDPLVMQFIKEHRVAADKEG